MQVLESPSTELSVLLSYGLYHCKPADLDVIFPSEICTFPSTAEVSQRDFNCRTSDLPIAGLINLISPK